MAYRCNSTNQDLLFAYKDNHPTNKASQNNSQALDIKSAEIAKTRGLYGLGEAYMAGEWESQNLDNIIRSIALQGYCKKISLRRLFKLLTTLFINHQKGQKAFEVAERHYDLSNRLFTAMLDSSMSYTCGYWREAKNLEEAQTAKLRLICEKLKLAPGMRVLDIGCGWGNFAHYASTHYGVEVVGLTVSNQQAEIAKARCAKLPVEIRLQDYQKFKERIQFDRVVSIEMIEAVGKKNLPKFYETIKNSLKDSGIFLLQVITGEMFSRTSNPALDDYLVWLIKYIFPNGYLPSSRELFMPEKYGLKIENIHNLGSDYIKTLTAWQENFENNWFSLKQEFSDSFKRMWLYYLAGCRVMFELSFVQIYQIAYSKQPIKI
ncbi:MAG TPA: class I SAM-dependent methyltransferase [Oligoflexia bacterium]|nr:class I SAM-dependent methyltransferase [Oligoflexia bacterium]HMP26433.1 class I SAM-dependent methyltransferase [Oligoflexia bacterium]